MSERPPDAPAEAPDPASDEREPEAIAASSDPAPQGSLTALQVMASTLAAAFGVQSSRNRHRDFTRGKAWHFILAGIVFTVVFVVGMVWVVGLVLDSAT
jgi:hypothetical protein